MQEMKVSLFEKVQCLQSAFQLKSAWNLYISPFSSQKVVRLRPVEKRFHFIFLVLMVKMYILETATNFLEVGLN